METIPQTMKKISILIDNVFESIIKLMLKKIIGSNVLYNKHRNTNTPKNVYNMKIDEKINCYVYTMSSDSIGWTSDVYLKFSFTSKQKALITNKLKKTPTLLLGTKIKLPISSDDKKHSIPNSKHMCNNTVTYIVNNILPANNYNSSTPYYIAMKYLNIIGEEILDQTEPELSGLHSSMMSTANIRAKLYELEIELQKLSVERSNIFDSYIEMIRLINSIEQKHMNIVMQLINQIHKSEWHNLDKKTQHNYIKYLGEDFINELISNDLVTILIQSNNINLIIKCSHLFPLLKMLFTIFGYSKLSPNVIDDISDEQYLMQSIYRDRFNVYRGAYIVRDNSDIYDKNMYYSPPNTENEYDNNMYYSPSNINIENEYDMPQNIDPIDQNIEPVNRCIYEYIRSFGELYPTIIGLLGGTENFPPESIQIMKDDIPENYRYLTSIPEFLWRFNDYSYCQMLSIQAESEVNSALEFSNNINTTD